ncbi:MAG TPA: glutathione peroxidase [Saprospiraceae bacterium]|nr:glutathione peroxidase [Saprospiraceae bacterium]
MFQKNSIHRFKVESIEGREIDFVRFKGKKIMIVNVASECGYTSQYEQLQELYANFQDRLIIVGFPCNDFGAQEPGSHELIQQFCQKNYGVTFPLTKKITINSPAMHPVYKWLTSRAENGAFDSEVSWNFQKYLLDENGFLQKVFPPATLPIDPEILDWINS